VETGGRCISDRGYPPGPPLPLSSKPCVISCPITIPMPPKFKACGCSLLKKGGWRIPAGNTVPEWGQGINCEWAQLCARLRRAPPGVLSSNPIAWEVEVRTPA
jgi:hypothetical protein